MGRLLPISPYRLEKIILGLGFVRLRQKGSHVFYQHPDGRYTTISFHGNREIGPVMLKIILKEIKVDRDEFEQYL